MSASESLHEQVKKYVNVPQNFVVSEEYFLKWNCFVSYQLQFQPLLPLPAYTKMEKFKIFPSLRKTIEWCEIM